MKCLSIQIQPDKQPDLEAKDVIEKIKVYCSGLSIVSSLELNESFDKSRYINVNIITNNLKLLWDKLSKNVYKDSVFGPYLSKTSIVVCEGNNGWDDYLLLHHFDKSEAIDNL